MANERLDKLETDMSKLNNKFDELYSMVRKALDKGKEPALEDLYNDHEGESSHSPHVGHTHPPPNRDLPLSQRPPKLDMQKFDGSNLSAWLAQIEQYFKLNRLQDDWTKIGVETMYLDIQRCLTKLRQTNTVDEYIIAFEALAFRTQHLSDEFYTECFISGLKEEAIKAQVLLHPPPTWSEACQVARKVERAITAQYSRPNFPTKGRPPQAHTTTQTLKVQKVSPQEMAERRKQGLCYYCDEKYSPGHKSKEPKFFQMDATDYSSTEEDPPLEEQEAEEDNQKDIVSDDPVISLNALAGISSPKTLKIRGFLKHRPVIVLIDSGSTHNFIHQKIAEAAHSFVRAVSNFQVQIADGGTMKCEGRCENVKIQMGDYQLKTNMFAIHMGGCDIVLGAEWLRILGQSQWIFRSCI
eukprot:PITA_28285